MWTTLASTRAADPSTIGCTRYKYVSDVHCDHGMEDLAAKDGQSHKGQHRKTDTHRIHNGNCVVEAEDEEKGSTEGEAGEQDVPDPLTPLHLCVIGSRCVAADTGSQSVKNNESCEQRSSVVGVEGAHARQSKDGKG